MNPKDITLNEISQSQEDKYYRILLMYNVEEANSEMENRTLVSRNWARVAQE